MNFLQTVGVIFAAIACAVLGWLVFETRILMEDVHQLEIKISKCNKTIHDFRVPSITKQVTDSSPVTNPSLDVVSQELNQINEKVSALQKQQENMTRSIIIQYVIQDRKDMALDFLRQTQGLDGALKSRWSEGLTAISSWTDLRQQVLEETRQDGTHLSPMLLERLGIIVKKEETRSLILDKLLDALNKQNFILACSFRDQGLKGPIEEELQKICDLRQVLE